MTGASLRAAKVALIALAFISAFLAAVAGAVWLAYLLLGKWGIVALWVSFTFAIFWIAALLDLRKGDAR